MTPFEIEQLFQHRTKLAFSKLHEHPGTLTIFAGENFFNLPTEGFCREVREKTIKVAALVDDVLNKYGHVEGHYLREWVFLDTEGNWVFFNKGEAVQGIGGIQAAVEAYKEQEAKGAQK